MALQLRRRFLSLLAFFVFDFLERQCDSALVVVHEHAGLPAPEPLPERVVLLVLLFEILPSALPTLVPACIGKLFSPFFYSAICALTSSSFGTPQGGRF